MPSAGTPPALEKYPPAYSAPQCPKEQSMPEPRGCPPVSPNSAIPYAARPLAHLNSPPTASLPSKVAMASTRPSTPGRRLERLRPSHQRSPRGIRSLPQEQHGHSDALTPGCEAAVVGSGRKWTILAVSTVPGRGARPNQLRAHQQVLHQSTGRVEHVEGGGPTCLGGRNREDQLRECMEGIRNDADGEFDGTRLFAWRWVGSALRCPAGDGPCADQTARGIVYRPRRFRRRRSSRGRSCTHRRSTRMSLGRKPGSSC
jgi:hypothetical protein